MNFWSPENLRAVVGGMWLARPTAEASGLSTDSRSIAPAQLFLALRGETFDGNTMVASAAASGSPLAIIDNPEAAGPLPPGMGILRVPDTRRALLKLGAAYRKSLEGVRILAVAGSNGKTTTVRLLDAVLGAAMRGTASQKSFNNAVGVPLTLLSGRPGDQYLICEIGTNAPGEVGELAAVVAPDIAVVTSIGREHLEKLGSLRGVAREEASLLEHIRTGGAAVINADAPHLLESVAALGRKPRAVISFGEGERADVRVVAVEQGFGGVRFTLNDRSVFDAPLLGRHNALNAAAAVAVGRRLGLSNEQIGAGLRKVRSAEMRLERAEVGGIRVINDAYNANPDSMKAALDTFAALDAGTGRRVVVLGDMLELGEHAESSHAELGRRLAAVPGLDLIVLVGDSMRHAARALEDASGEGRVVRVEELDGPRAKEVAGLLRKGDLVLLKGSRRMRLERLVAALPPGGNDAKRRSGRGPRAPAA
ncbi:MAG: UDP-N-acetylmuramoyl-tripeptide--D-alanyl-D-alanine ligase [Phycisphaerales bacterium]